MATYVPNATQVTEPVESRTVESAALEFRTLKDSINTRIAALEVDDLRDLRVPESSVNPVPAAAARAGKVLAFDAAGNPTTIIVGDSADSSLRTDLASSGGAAMAGYMPAGAGAVATTVESKLRDTVSVKDFYANGMSGVKVDPTGVVESSAGIQAANTYAQSINARLVFPGGTYNVGTASFVIDPQKTRWIADGVVTLQWSAAPVSGYGVRAVAGEAAAYGTGRKMVADVLDGFSLCGSATSGALYSAQALEIGDGTNQTYGLNFKNLSIQGFTTTIYFNSNVWSIRFENPRILWGAIDMPTSPVNFGENMGFVNPFFADGVAINIRLGEWTFLGGSLDNSTLTQSGLSTVKWYGPHFENPGTTTIAAPYVSLTYIDAACYLHAVELITNNSGVAGSITTSPFNVSSDVTVGGLFIDGITYTQQGTYAFDNLISGAGRAVVTKPVPLALSNFYFQTFATNHPGTLRNWGFEENSMAGWQTGVTGTSTVAATTGRKRTGSYSGLFTCSGGSGFVSAAAAQKSACTANQFATIAVRVNRDFTGLNSGETGVINCKLDFLDVLGNSISSSAIGTYVSAPNGTDDGSAWNTLRYAGFAPAGSAYAYVTLEFQRPTGTGTAKFYVDDVVLNVC